MLTLTVADCASMWCRSNTGLVESARLNIIVTGLWRPCRLWRFRATQMTTANSTATASNTTTAMTATGTMQSGRERHPLGAVSTGGRHVSSDDEHTQWKLFIGRQLHRWPSPQRCVGHGPSSVARHQHPHRQRHSYCCFNTLKKQLTNGRKFSPENKRKEFGSLSPCTRSVYIAIAYGTLQPHTPGCSLDGYTLAC